MALQFMDGFDAYSSSQSGEDFNSVWTGISTIQFITGRYSGEAIKTAQYIGGWVCRQVVSETTMIVGCAINPNSNLTYFGFATSNGAPIGFLYINNGVSTLQLGGSLSSMPAGGTQVATMTVPGFNPTQWTYYELEIVQGTSGSLTLRANGAQIGTLSGNTAIAGIGALGSVLIGTQNNGEFDDLYVLDSTGTINTTFLAPAGGDVRVATFLPTGAGADTQLTPNGASTNWQCVSEQSPDFDSTYVSSATAGQEDLYAFAPALPTTNQILGVVVKTLARKDDSNTREIASLLSSGATVAQGATNALGSTYIAYEDTYNTDPNTSAAWTVAAVNALQAGVKVIA